jgi:hypothetical protein
MVINFVLQVTELLEANKESKSSFWILFWFVSLFSFAVFSLPDEFFNMIHGRKRQV